MSNETPFGSQPDFSQLTPDDDVPPVIGDRRSADAPVDPESLSSVNDHDDGPEVLAELKGADGVARRSGLPPVKWAPDLDHPDFAHLIGAEEDGIGPDKTFKLTPDVLELLIEANSFRPNGPDGKFVFGLRGGLLANGKRQVEDAAFVELIDTRPDHQNFRCTIGYYDRANKLMTVYLASTVPNRYFMENYYRIINRMNPRSSTRANLLPTGCYEFHIGTHRDKVDPALRMIDPDMTVLRTSDDLTFSQKDFWDRCEPYDNIHCAYTETEFSSAGCQTISGGLTSGPWGHFRKELQRRSKGTPYSYMLLTGREAAIAAKILELSPPNKDQLVNRYLRCLRLGSHGPAVEKMQIGMGYSGKTQFFGPGTRLKLVELEREKNLPSDSIYSAADDAAFGWGAFKAAGAPGDGAGGTDGSGGTGTQQMPPAGLVPESLVLVGGPPGSTIFEEGKKLVVPAEGTWTVEAGTGKLKFTPAAGFHGAVTPVTYRISDAAGGTATAKVSLTVLKVNKAPVVQDDVVRIVEGKPVTIAVLANDVDTDGTIDPKSVVLVSAPTGSQISANRKQLSVPNMGIWTVDPSSGDINFSPVAGFTGIVRTTYEVTDDGGKKAQGQVTVTVAPEFKPPTAIDDVVEGEAGAPVVIDVLSNDTAGAQVTVPGSTQPVPLPPVAVTPLPVPPATGGTGGATDEVVFGGGITYTEEQLRKFAPRAKEKYIRALVDHGPQILAQHGITATALRFCHFMAQIGHESGGLTIDTESLNYTTPSRLCAVWPTRFPNVSYAAQFCNNEEKLANKVYDGRVKDLGNTQPGDGYKYRGRGLIQVTGRGGYREIGRRIGVDLENNPDLATEGPTAVKVAAQTWTDRTLKGRTMNQLADANKIDIITLRINGGYTGLAKRRAEFERAWAIWGNGAAPRSTTDSELIERGQRGEEVKVVQQLLVKTGYFPADEKIDGIFGGNTMNKVALFQYNYNKTATGPQKLNVNGIVDKKTLMALKAAPAVERRRRSAAPIPRNARDPRQLGRPPASHSPDRRFGTPGSPDRLPGILQLVGVLMTVMAIGTIIVGRNANNGQLLFSVWPLAMAAIAVLSFVYASHRAALSGQGNVSPVGSRPIDPWVNPTGEYVPPVVQPEIDAVEPDMPAAAGGGGLPDLDAPLQEFGFSDKDFEDSEPIRHAPGLATDVDLSETTAIDVPLPAILPEDDLEVPGAPDKRNAFGAVRSPRATAFNVSTHDVPLVLIMMFGGDNNLSHQVANDLNEIASGIRAGRGMAAVIALADVENAPASVIEVTPAGDQRTITQLGEIDTGDPDTLATFVSRALATYPQARKAIGFWDHGTGVFDEFDDAEVLLTRSLKPRQQRRARPARRLLIPASQRAQLNSNPTTRGMLHDSTGGILTNVEAGRMLRAAFFRAGQTLPVDLIYSDTCLNGMIEVLEELGPYAQCVVASPDTEPGAGWDYESWIGSAGRNFPTTPALWAQSAVRSFSDRYRDDVDQHPCTLAAFQAENQIAETFARLVEVVKPTGMVGWNLLTTARGYAQSYDNRDAFDLMDFAQQLHEIAKTSDPAIAAAAADLDKACRDARIDNAAHGSMVAGAKGLAFWFPSSRRNLQKDLPTYRSLKFAQLTGWADYLESQYGGGA